MKNQNPLKVFLLVTGFTLLAIALAACSDTPSSNIKTSGLYASYSVFTNNGGSSVECQAIFQVGGSTGTYVQLDQGDSVTCNGQAMSYQDDPIFHQIIYTVSLPASSNSNYSFSFSRTGEGTYASSVNMPSALQQVSPQNGSVFRKGSPIHVSWTPSTDPLASTSATLSFNFSTSTSSQSHIAYTSDSSPESGSLNFLSSDTQVSPPVAGTWNAMIQLTRKKYGAMSTQLKGSIWAEQILPINISLVD